MKSRTHDTRPHWFRVGRIGRILYVASQFCLSPLQRSLNVAPKDITAFLIVRDIVSPCEAIIDSLRAEGVLAENIIILDTGTTFKPSKIILTMLKERGHRVISLESTEQQFGPYALWRCARLRRLLPARAPFFVTDGDLEFPCNKGTGWLSVCIDMLNYYKYVPKISLSLRLDDIDTVDAELVCRHETALKENILFRTLGRLLLDNKVGCYFCPTDTTASLYRPNKLFTTFSLRLKNLQIRHLPWYREFRESEEFIYYKKNKVKSFGMWS